MLNNASPEMIRLFHNSSDLRILMTQDALLNNLVRSGLSPLEIIIALVDNRQKILGDLINIHKNGLPPIYIAASDLAELQAARDAGEGA